MRTAKTAKQIRPRGQRGVTLVELMIALVLTAVIGGALYRGLVNQSKSFVQQDQSDEAMQHCRTATDQILRELRMAGYVMAYQDSSGITVNDQGIVVGTTTLINNTTLTTNNDTNRGTTDSLVIRRGDSVPWSVWMYFIHPEDKWIRVMFEDKITVRLDDPDYVLLIDANRSEFRSVKVMEKGMHETYANKKFIRVQDYTGSIASTHGKDEATNYTGGTCVKLKEIAFYIDTSSGIPTLMKAVNGYSSQIVARYVEDLQVAYQDNAGVWYRGGSGTTQTNPPTVNNIRNVRINIVARASTASARTPYYQAALEDGNRHPATGGDGYLRRSLTSQVRARNFGVD